MRFTLALPMCPADRLLTLARIADDAGWDAVSMPDSVFFPEEVSADYPYTSDGRRFWPDDAPWVDPWVAIPAMAAVTERLAFYTNVLKTPLRHPLLVAKTVGSTAAMFPGRIGLGVGLSWMPEEFSWLHQDMRTRGKRLDEQIEVLRAVLDGGWVEHHGPHYDFDRLRMEPSPSERVPIYVGGHSDPALRRAARLGDGWIGAQVDQAEAAAVVKRLHEALDEAGRSRDGFEVKLTPIVPATPEAMGELASVGVTDVITVPWFFAGGDPTDPAEQERSIAWFADTVIDPVLGGVVTGAEHPARAASRQSMAAVEAGDRDAWLALFAPDAVVQDPIGVSPLDPTGLGHHGVDAIAAFYDTVIAPNRVSFDIRESYAAGNEVANVGTITTTFDDGGRALVDGVYTYRVDDDGRLVALRAYWEVDALRYEPPSGASPEG